MTSLPFLTPPVAQEKRKCGNAASGVLEMPVLGGLTVGEAAVISDLLANEQSSFVKGAQISDAIAKAEGISISEAFNIIEKSITGQELEEEADEIRQRNIESTVTALVRCRLDLPSWSVDDTRKMHRALYNDIWALAQDEQEAEDNPATPPTEEELGKQPAAAGRGRKRTGGESSGS